jgi:hypothetical protein
MWRQFLELDQLVRGLDNDDGGYRQEEDHPQKEEDHPQEVALDDDFAWLRRCAGHDERGPHRDQLGTGHDACLTDARAGTDAYDCADPHDRTKRAQLDPDDEAAEAEVGRRVLGQ